jgi:hypothetical protein
MIDRIVNRLPLFCLIRSSSGELSNPAGKRLADPINRQASERRIHLAPFWHFQVYANLA